MLSPSDLATSTRHADRPPLRPAPSTKVGGFLRVVLALLLACGLLVAAVDLVFNLNLFPG